MPRGLPRGSLLCVNSEYFAHSRKTRLRVQRGNINLQRKLEELIVQRKTTYHNHLLLKTMNTQIAQEANASRQKTMSPILQDFPLLKQCFKGAAILALISASTATLMAAPVFDVNFESPTYTVGDSFIAGGANTLDVNGPAPSAITGMATFGSTGWNATVEAAGPTGNRLTFANTEATTIDGRFECFAPPVGGNTGTWFIQLDYTRLYSAGGLMLNFHIVDNGGSDLVPVVGLYSDKWQGISLAVGSTSTLRIELDMGTSNWRTYYNGTLAHSYTTSISAGKSLGGLSAYFANIAGPTTYFALDNIQIGAVPEPSAVTLLAVGGLASLVALRKRRLSK